jgi:hypothetical protein
MPLDEQGWRTLIRRAFGIPDLIGAEVTDEFIADAVYSAPVAREETRGVDVEFEEEIGHAILDETVKAAAQGKLDRFITYRRDDGNHEPSSVVSVDEAIINAVRVRTGEHLPFGLAVPILTKLRDYVLAHPFEPEPHE